MHHSLLLIRWPYFLSTKSNFLQVEIGYITLIVLVPLADMSLNQSPSFLRSQFLHCFHFMGSFPHSVVLTQSTLPPVSVEDVASDKQLIPFPAVSAFTSIQFKTLSTDENSKASLAASLWFWRHPPEGGTIKKIFFILYQPEYYTKIFWKRIKSTEPCGIVAKSNADQ